VQVGGRGRKLKLGRFNELLIAAVQQSGHLAIRQNSGGYGKSNRRVVRFGAGIELRPSHENRASPVLANQNAACNFGVRRHIEGVRAQGVKSLIEVRITGFSAHGCLPVCEDVEERSSLVISNLAQQRRRPQFSMEIRTPQSRPGSSLPKRIGKAQGVRPVRLNAAVYAAIRAHGEETYPNECCGVLLGRISEREGWQIEAAVRAGNARADAARNRYEIAPAELVKIAREARGLRLEIAGFYHSHPDHAAQWSLTDLAEAHWLGCCYIITSVVKGKAAATNCFLLTGESEEEKRFEQQAIELGDENQIALQR